MFVVNMNNQVFFHNDDKDVYDMLSGWCFGWSSAEYQALADWMWNASFGNSFSEKGVTIYCVTEQTARDLASFYGILPAFEKEYGHSFGKMVS